MVTDDGRGMLSDSRTIKAQTAPNHDAFREHRACASWELTATLTRMLAKTTTAPFAKMQVFELSQVNLQASVCT